MAKILNLYSGIGGNRRLWGEGHEVTAVELDADIAKAYSSFFPSDHVVVDDAHEYLRRNFTRFDFIWSSPPCQSHSRARGKYRFPVFPDFSLYEEIVFLQRYADKSPLWVVENVIPYYGALFDGKVMGRHMWWSNFDLPELSGGGELHREHSISELESFHGFDLSGHVFDSKKQVLRNCVHGPDGLLVLERALELLDGDRKVSTG
jgi:DNA (cytosine-5)-methyltransferase 1